MSTKKTKKNSGFKCPRMSTAKILGGRLRVWRQGAGRTLKQAARDLRVSISVVSQWERGLRFPSVKNLHKIACYMELPVCDLLYNGKSCCCPK